MPSCKFHVKATFSITATADRIIACQFHSNVYYMKTWYHLTQINDSDTDKHVFCPFYMVIYKLIFLYLPKQFLHAMNSDRRQATVAN